ncbi:conserved hypothetical protein [Neospora caninum Liverpool]|uniref:Uncharacterized protein n=1 Tax=Neospora caninum (strain Liverpool) TaxID=572307 RepID=F0VKP9_NEOCL|nr:conserved hypothetical protein [Neospora caninum Liverpool]CBZ54650.1 conserved hypothetical protein [Neospora caninum Liverpool]CEL69367.1 TPA: hypothetical protein BN1204_050780 [Neospora caninum Liverpool]|eukprot:XP_003884680.1 conserved hypothetical protein [Neospora caninum Liverpool]
MAALPSSPRSLAWPRSLPLKLRPFLPKLAFFTGCVASVISQLGVAATTQRRDTGASSSELGFLPVPPPATLGDSPDDTPGHGGNKRGTDGNASYSGTRRSQETRHTDSQEEEYDDEQEEPVSIPVDKRVAARYRFPLREVDTRRSPSTKKGGNAMKDLLLDTFPGLVAVTILGLLYRRLSKAEEGPAPEEPLWLTYGPPPVYEPWRRVARRPRDDINVTQRP